MNKIILIIKREYLTRVKKKSFIIMTFFGPVLMGLLLIVPVWLAQVSDEVRTIEVIDDSHLFANRIADKETIKFDYKASTSLEEAKAGFEKSSYYGILYIPELVINDPNSVMFFSRKQASFLVTIHIQSSLESELTRIFLSTEKIDPEILETVKAHSNVKLNTINISEEGKEKKGSTELSMALGMFGAVLVYFLIFMYGTQVLRGVIEEKTNRIIEIMISSVKPFQLMMGKIIGVALVGVTQFILWIVLTSVVSGVIGKSIPDKYSSNNIQQVLKNKSELGDPAKLDKASDMVEMIEAAKQVDFKVMGLAALFFFIGGYFLYSALFAAVGAAIDNEADSQQFMLPITIPLILSFMMAQFIIENPESPVAFWFSIFPLTSPVVMMVRIPFGVPMWQFALSATLLVMGFIAATWFAARIYRVGILMYGKKVTYKELWKWFRYSI